MGVSLAVVILRVVEMTKPIALSRLWLIPLLGITVAFLLLYAENLHCDQYASFLGAAFGERHPEDRLGYGQGMPLVYRDWIGLPVRLAAAASVLLGVLGAFIMLRAQRQRRCGFWLTVTASLLLALLPAISARALGQSILGERFEALGLPASAVGLVVSLIAIIPSAILSARRRSEDA